MSFLPLDDDDIVLVQFLERPENLLTVKESSTNNVATPPPPPVTNTMTITSNIQNVQNVQNPPGLNHPFVPDMFFLHSNVSIIYNFKQ